MQRCGKWQSMVVFYTPYRYIIQQYVPQSSFDDCAGMRETIGQRHPPSYGTGTGTVPYLYELL